MRQLRLRLGKMLIFYILITHPDSPLSPMTRLTSLMIRSVMPETTMNSANSFNNSFHAAATGLPELTAVIF